MSRITNRKDLPDAVVRAVENDPYDRGDAEFTITELIDPPRVGALKKKHADELTEDASDRMDSLYGQLIHGMLERANTTSIVERRFYGKIGGVRVSGRIDELDLVQGILRDWKFTKAKYFGRSAQPRPEWIMQLNFQLELIRQNGYDVHTLQIGGLLKDWSKIKSLHSRSYPQTPVPLMDIPMWDREETIIRFKERVFLHRQAQTSLPNCTSEDRWGGVRCQAYCPVAGFCSQAKRPIDVAPALPSVWQKRIEAAAVGRRGPIMNKILGLIAKPSVNETADEEEEHPFG